MGEALLMQGLKRPMKQNGAMNNTRASGAHGHLGSSSRLFSLGPVWFCAMSPFLWVLSENGMMNNSSTLVMGTRGYERCRSIVSGHRDCWLLYSPRSELP